MCPACTAQLDCTSVSLTSVFVSVPYAPAIEVLWATPTHVVPGDVLFYRHHVGCVTLSVSPDHVTTVSALCTACRPLLLLSVCPNIVAIICHPVLGVVVRPLSGC